MKISPIIEYLRDRTLEEIDPGFVAYLTSLEKIAEVSPHTAGCIVQELSDQRANLKLIASENYSSLSTQLSMGNLLTDKYAEGAAYRRFYAGCENIDAIEKYTAELACKLFNAEHAYVQPHSGADANLIAYWAILTKMIHIPALEKLGEKDQSKLSRDEWNKIRQECGNQRLLGLDYYSGGHLTHGYRHNISSQLFDSYTYKVNKETGYLDYDEIEKMALEIKPLVLLTGYSAYPRLIDFKRMKQIADKVGAVFMVDMAHFSGLVAGKVFTGNYDPVPFADVVTSTTHKTLRGPRGGLILCKKEFAEYIDKGCPLVIGGPLPNIIVAKAVAFTEADTKEFSVYAEKIVENCKTMSAKCVKNGMKIATGGSDNHLFLIDVREFNLNGRQAEAVLRECRITMNRNSLPFDPNGPWYTSGLRIGTPAMTTLGMGKSEMEEIADILYLVLSNTSPKTLTKGENAGKLSKVKYNLSPAIKKEAEARVDKLLSRYPVYPELDLEFLRSVFPCQCKYK